ncbi:MFS general substrate transporter [Aspergillus tetrazonus]
MQKSTSSVAGAVQDPTTDDTRNLPSKIQLTLIIVSLCLAVFCQALDTTIIATAIPRITDEFDSLGDVGWYGAAYLLANCASLLSYGKLYNLLPAQWVFLGALAVFELGSLVCGATPSSVGLILGRVLQGIGAGGLLSGATLIIAATVPLRRRPMFQGMLGAMYALASVAGPLMGGAITDHVTWRFCFYINLPLGFVSAIVIVFFARKIPPPPGASASLRQKAIELDPIGLLTFMPMIVCLLLAIQWGGTTYSWRNARIIVLFILGGLLLLVFIGIQVWQKDRAMVPRSVATKRTVWASCVFSFFLFGSLLIMSYYLPIWFQAIKGDTASDSGVHILPLLLGSVIMSIIAGGLVAAVGYYTWACLVATVLTSVFTAQGSGLMTTFDPASRIAKWIGYQAIYGAGIGFGLQQPLIAIQTALPENQVAEGTAVILFIQTFGGAIFLAVGQNVLSSRLIANVRDSNIPIDARSLLSQGATSLESIVPSEYLPELRNAYNKALVHVFYAAVATAGLSIFGSAFLPWYSVKEKDKSKGADAAGENAFGGDGAAESAGAINPGGEPVNEK